VWIPIDIAPGNESDFFFNHGFVGGKKPIRFHHRLHGSDPRYVFRHGVGFEGVLLPPMSMSGSFGNVNLPCMMSLVIRALQRV
jgi:hypothetical protein